jgi:predicted acylesterase/phospholipase RssA
MIPWTPNVVVIGPGGTFAYYYIGALQALSDNGYLESVTTMVGVSAGSLIAVLMAAGYTADQLFNEGISTELFALVQVNTFQSLLASWGFMSSVPLEQRLSILLKAKLGFVPTFKELYDLTQKTAIVVASDIDARTPIYFDHVSSPNYSVVDAVVASCTVPLLFSQRTYGGHRIIDGAFTDPYPLHLGARVGNTLGLIMMTHDDTASNETYPIASYTLPIHMLKMASIDTWKDAPTVYHIPIATEYSTMDMFSEDQKRIMVKDGYDTIKKHVRV